MGRSARQLPHGTSPPGALLRACPGLSAKVMNERLQKMVRFGILRRSVAGEKPPIEVDYALTAFGQRFIEWLDDVRRLQDDVDRGSVPAVPDAEAHQRNAGGG